jgi:hypothetical protein
MGCAFPGEMTPGGSVAISFSEAATTFQFHRQSHPEHRDSGCVNQVIFRGARRIFYVRFWRFMRE